MAIPSGSGTTSPMTEGVVMQLGKALAPAWKIGKNLLLFCGVGGLCGVAIGFFMYLHLGPFKNPQDAGYAAGLFVKSGVELGFFVWMVQAMVLGLRRWDFGLPKRMR
jgi:hypothetical protein